jgi:DNA-binding MarR family transcriptional regulator
MTDDPSAPPAGAPFDFDTAADPLGQRLVTGLAKIGLATRHRAWSEAEGRGLTPTQGQILALLRPRRETGMRLAEVAEALAVSPPTASVAVAALVAKGLVSKRRAPDDARAVAIALTEAGTREAERAAGWADFLLAAVDELAPPEQEVFFRGLVKMIRALQERGDIPVSRMCVTCRFFRPNAYPGAAKPHNCAFVDAPFGDRHLRLECADHRPAPATQAEAAWRLFAGPDAAAGADGGNHHA